MLDITTAPFWIAVLQIIAIDILLGGDNAVVIALACRKLPDAQRNKGIFWGVVGAIILRVALIFFALQLLAIPWLKIVGGVLLVWIGIKLLQPEEGGHGDVAAADTLFSAIKTIIVADAVMSLDNVIGVAGAAHGDIRLVVFGILFSIPIVVWGSKLVLKLMDRFPQVISAGGALLGWIAGGMMVSDPALPADFSTSIPHIKLIFEVTGAVIVLVIGSFLARRAAQLPQTDIAAQNKESSS
ncbi:MAG: TerC family protein [Rhodocyclaceae bacterium]|jgi:YjbE family integral membrane protein|nr:TerC family protein [Rhodocyclaceae bacterium]